MKIDYDKLRKDLETDSCAAYFGGGFGAALIDALDTEHMLDDKLLDTAKRNGFDLTKYTEED